MSKPRCIIINHTGNSIDKYFPLEQCDIICLVARDIEAAKAKYGNHCKHYLSFTTRQGFENNYKNNYNLTYAHIERYRATQLKIEHGLQRQFTDMGIIQQKYFIALSYWLEIFESHTIDACFLVGQNHSMPYDCIPVDIGISKNIPTFNISNPLGYGNTSITQAILLNSKDFIKLNNNPTHHHIYAFIEGLQEYYQKNLFKRKKIGFSNPYKFFFKSQVRTFPCLIANLFRSPYKKYKRAFVKQPLLERHEIFTASLYVKDLKRLYDKISHAPSLEENYIYYSLHQEPEASIMAVTTLNAQLLIIQWLSECLPKGWKLYIKEHPSQFFCYDRHDYFLKNIHEFRSSKFYQQILSLPNTTLIDINTPSNTLIKNAKAVASICGSALLEAVALHKKPIIIFGQNVLFLELLKESFKITSKDLLQEAITKIEGGGHSPTYSDFGEIVSNFTLLSSDTAYNEKMKDVIQNLIRSKNAD